MLSVKNLYASVGDKQILRGINLEVRAGEVHAIMGPNGSGKSTLSNVLVGHPAYTVTEGEVIYKGKNLLELSPEDRSHEGLFLSFQYPVEIPGVSMANFLKLAVNEKRKYQGKEPLTAGEFLKMMKERAKVVEIDSQGRINLSRRDALVEINGAVVEEGADEEAPRKPRRDNNRRGFRKHD